MGETKGKEEEGEKEKSQEKNGITVVLKTEMHCEGCATKIRKCVKTIEGVKKAKAEWEANKLTVRGEVDPSELRDELQERLNKKVELVSPQPPKKDKDGDNNKGDNKKSDSKNNKKNDDKGSKDSKKSNDEKPKQKKEATATTAVLKLRLHCSGCIDKIQKTASRTKGVESVTIDRETELVTVKGMIDAKALAESLEEKMKRSVAIVAPKNKEGGSGSEENNNTGGGGGGKKKEQDSGGVGGGEAETDGGVVEGKSGEYVGLPMPPSYAPLYGPPGYGPVYSHPYPYPYTYGNNLHAPQMFSDENPNACSVM